MVGGRVGGVLVSESRGSGGSKSEGKRGERRGGRGRDGGRGGGSGRSLAQGGGATGAGRNRWQVEIHDTEQAIYTCMIPC